MTDKEFHRVFKRLVGRISFTGCRTPNDVNRRLLKNKYKRPYASRGDPLDILRASNNADQLARLVPYFGERVIAEAYTKPNGIVAQYLRYDRKKAEAKFKQIKEWRLDRKYKRAKRW